MDHVQELRSRLFWVALSFVVAAGVAYPFVQDIIKLLVRPLGKHELYYMSPAGGLSFLIKVCMYTGFIAILPVVIYQLYRFVAPVMQKGNARRVLRYTLASTVLAVAGIVFAYVVSLPAALHFLTGIDINNVSSMLTIDAYMSFIMAYLLAGAFLFQLPLVMLIINTIAPLKPKKLMSYQRYILVGSFIVAAVISPTPDVVNQTLLAAPMMLMYQVGIALVWLQQRSVRKKNRRLKGVVTDQIGDIEAVQVDALLGEGGLLVAAKDELKPVVQPVMQKSLANNLFTDVATAAPQARQVSTLSSRPVELQQHAQFVPGGRNIRRSIDGMVSAPIQRSSSRAALTVQPRSEPTRKAVPPVYVRTTIDGFLVPA